MLLNPIPMAYINGAVGWEQTKLRMILLAPPEGSPPLALEPRVFLEDILKTSTMSKQLLEW